MIARLVVGDLHNDRAGLLVWSHAGQFRVGDYARLDDNCAKPAEHVFLPFLALSSKIAAQHGHQIRLSVKTHCWLQQVHRGRVRVRIRGARFAVVNPVHAHGHFSAVRQPGAAQNAAGHVQAWRNATHGRFADESSVHHAVPEFALEAAIFNRASLLLQKLTPVTVNVHVHNRTTQLRTCGRTDLSQHNVEVVAEQRHTLKATAIKVDAVVAHPDSRNRKIAELAHSVKHAVAQVVERLLRARHDADDFFRADERSLDRSSTSNLAAQLGGVFKPPPSNCDLAPALVRSGARRHRLDNFLVVILKFQPVAHLVRAHTRRRFQQQASSLPGRVNAGQPKLKRHTLLHELAVRVLVPKATHAGRLAAQRAFGGHHGGHNFLLVEYAHDVVFGVEIQSLHKYVGGSAARSPARKQTHELDGRTNNQRRSFHVVNSAIHAQAHLIDVSPNVSRLQHACHHIIAHPQSLQLHIANLALQQMRSRPNEVAA